MSISETLESLLKDIDAARGRYNVKRARKDAVSREMLNLALGAAPIAGGLPELLDEGDPQLLEPETKEQALERMRAMLEWPEVKANPTAFTNLARRISKLRMA